MSVEGLSLEAQEVLGQLREEPRTAEEKERLLAAMDALKFISATGQAHDFEVYRRSLEDKAPPLVIATFDTRAEANAWLEQHPSPPNHAYVLVGGEYHVVMHVPELNHRRLISHPVLEFYLSDMVRERVASPAATFHTKEEAQAWLDTRSVPPRQVFIRIAGADYLVVYHHRVDLRAMYPLPSAVAPQPTGPGGHAG